MPKKTPFRSLLRKSSPAVLSPSRRRGTPSRRYAMAQSNRLTQDFSIGSLTADQAVNGSISQTRNRARVLERDDAYVRKFCVMAKNSIVGAKGIRLQSICGEYVKGKGFVASDFDQRIIEEKYTEFSKAWNFTADNRLDRRRFAQMGIQRVFIDGECIIRKHRGKGPHGLQLQMIDAELLDHTLTRAGQTNSAGQTVRNEIRMGVEVDEDQRPVAYYFLKEAPPTWAGTSQIGTKHTRVPADQIIHIYIQERPGQTRGITWLAPTALRTRMLDGIETAVTVGYRVAASKMGILTKTQDYDEPADTNGDAISALPTIPQDVSPGELLELPEGMGFESFDPGYPNADFDPFKKSIIREIAAGLGVSYPELGNDFQGVSYSAGQIGVHSDIAFWTDLQQFWVDTFEEPVYREWLLMAITKGELSLPLSKLTKFQAVKFQPPRRKHIDPLKTHNAQRVALGDMSRSPYDIAAENGCDFEDVVDDFKRAKELLAQNGLPMPASWGAALELPDIPDEP